MPIRPKLSFFDLTMIIISMVIGIGIFRNPAIIAQHAGSPAIFFLAWIIGGIVSICGALTFAEVGSRLPVAGGYYKMFSFCYHPTLAFMLIWTYIMLNAGSTAAVAFTGAQYIAPLVLPSAFQNESGTAFLFFLIVLALFTLNYLGIRIGAQTQNFLSLIKIGLLLIFCSAIFFSPAVNHITIQPVDHSTVSLIKALGISLIAVFFTYGGYQNTSNLGGDIKNAGKNIPRSILTAMGIVLFLYLLINFVYIRTLGFDRVSNSPLIAADLGEILFGNAGSAFASVAIFISVLGFINASLLFNPRVMYAMAADGILPVSFMKLNEKKQVQEFALIFFTALILLMFLLLQTYDNLLDYVMFNDTLSLAFAAFCIFILRRKQANENIQSYKVKWYPWIPLIFIIVIIGVNASVIISNPRNSAIGLFVLLLGYPMLLVIKKLRQKTDQ